MNREKEQDIYLESVALNLHGFCSRLERLFQLIVYIPTVYIPSDKEWTNNYQRRKKEGEK